MRGYEARQDIRRKAYMLAGAVVLVALVVVGLSGGLAASRREQEKVYRDPVRVLQRLAELEIVFRSTEGRYGSLDDLAKKNLITSDLAQGEIAGYVYRVATASPVAFAITADPDPARIASTVHFFVDDTHRVRSEQGKPAGPKSVIVYDPREGTR